MIYIRVREIGMFEWIRSKWSDLKHAFRRAVFVYSHKWILPLRYNIEVKGIEFLDPKKGGVDHSVLFLSNHSSHIDATILGYVILDKGLPLTIWALDETFKLPYLRWAARQKEALHVVKVPNINERRSEKHYSNLHKLVNRTGDGLRRGNNFLIFPAGLTKLTPVEKIDGKSAVPLVIRQYPEVNIVLVRVTGLWGSRFSGATKSESRWATHSVNSWTMFWQTLKMLVMNLFFFIPKRKILVEFYLANEEFPRFGSRLEIDRFMETWYNKEWGPKGEPLFNVPDYFWREIPSEHGYETKHYSFNLNLVPKPLRNAVVTLVADKANLDCKEIDFDMQLGRDLGLDSLDIVEILTELENRYHLKKHVPGDITTVGHLIAVAGKIPVVCEIRSGLFHEVEDKIEA